MKVTLLRQAVIAGEPRCLAADPSPLPNSTARPIASPMPFEHRRHKRYRRCLRAMHVGVPIVSMWVATALAFGADTPKTLKVAYFKGTSAVALFRAEQKGYFKDEGLEVQLVLMSDSPAAVTAVSDGTAQLGTAGLASIVVAQATGERLKMLLGVTAEDRTNIVFRLVASKRSGVKRFSDLKGKTILAGSVGGLCELSWRDWLADNHVNWGDVKVLHNSFFESEGLLRVGDADAACVTDPLYTSMRLSSSSDVLLASGLLAQEMRPYALGALFAKEEWISRNPGVVAKVNAALSRATRDLQQDPLAFRRLLVDEFGVAANVADFMRAGPANIVKLNAADILPIIEGMQRTHMLDERFSAADAIASPK